MKQAQLGLLVLSFAALLLPVNAVAADSPKDIVKKLVEEVWSKGTLEPAFQLVSPEYQFHNPMIRIMGPTGPDLMSSLIENRREAFPDLSFEILDLFGEEQKVVVRWSAKATHQGKLGNVEATGKEVSWEGTTVFHLAGGQIIAEWTIDGFAGVMRELGVTSMQVRRGGPGE